MGKESEADDDSRDFLKIHIVLETVTLRAGHNRKFKHAKMISGPPNVVCHIGEGGDEVDERGFLEMIQELARHGWSYSVNAVMEESNYLTVCDWVGQEVFANEQKYPDFDVRNW